MLYILGGGLLVGGAAEIARYLVGTTLMIRRDPLFKGCTRPALFLGVPLAPLAAVAAPILLLAIWLTLLLLLLLPLAIGVCGARSSRTSSSFGCCG